MFSLSNAQAGAEANPDTAQADTAQADAQTGKDTALAGARTGRTALLNPENVPTRAVQAAWFGGFDSALPNDSAPAAKMTIRLEGLGDVACREEAHIAWADIHSSEITLDFGRCNNDHNTALKYLRRQSDNNAVPLIELSQKTSINEIQHAWYGPEYFWWYPLPCHPKDTVMFNWSFKDFLKSWDVTSKQTFFGDGHGE